MHTNALRTHYDDAFPAVQRWLYRIPFICLLVYQQMLWSGIPLCGHPLPELVDNVEFFAMCLLMLRVLLFQRMAPKEIIMVGLMTAVIWASSRHADNRTVLLAWLFIIAAKDQSFEELVRIAFWILLTTTVLLMVLSLTGIIGDNLVPRFYSDPSRPPTDRHSLGFSHPNSLGMAVLHIYACWLFLRRDKISWWDSAIAIPCTIFVYLVPNSMSSCVCLLTLAAFSLLCSLGLPTASRRMFGWLLAVIPILANAFCVLYSLGFDSLPFARKLDGLLTLRLGFAFSIYSKFGISLLGTILPPMFSDVIIDGEPFYMPWLDASYMDLLLRYGLLTYLLYSGLYAATAFRIRKSGNLMLLGILTVYAAHGIMENSLYILRFSIFPIAMAVVLYGNEATVGKVYPGENSSKPQSNRIT